MENVTTEDRAIRIDIKIRDEKLARVLNSHGQEWVRRYGETYVVDRYSNGEIYRLTNVTRYTLGELRGFLGY